MNLGQIIRDFRKERNITLAELAGKLDISISYLSAIERNIRKPSVQMLKKIGDNLNVPINYLLGSEGDVLTGNKLKYMRESRDLSLEDLSEICDIPVNLLDKFEKGQEIPDLECLKKLSEVLNITIKYFLDRSDNRNDLGNRIKKLRMDRGMTIVALADKVGVTPGFISQIENGQANPQLATLEAIAKCLSTSASYLLMESRDVEDLLATLSPDMLDILSDPNVQAVLRSLRDFQTSEIKFIINYVQFFKQNKSML
ncbi:MAG: helix-turn-helix domain-containing protein [Eubacteriales bacterium]